MLIYTIDVKPIEGSVLVCESTEALTPKVSTLDKLETAVDAGNSGTELDGIYADIASTLSALVVVDESISELNELHDDAREYLKMLHLVVTGAWAKETLPEVCSHMYTYMHMYMLVHTYIHTYMCIC